MEDIIYGNDYYVPDSGGGGLDLSFITATSDKILEGYVGSDNEGGQIYGTMPNNTSTVPIKLPPDKEYYIPKGYHTGNGKIIAYHLSDVTPGTATEADIIANKTAWVNGVKLVGSMVDYSDQVIPRDGDTSHIKGIENYWETSTGKGSDIVIDIPQTGRFKNTKITQAIYGVHPDLIKYDAVIGSNPTNENGYHIKGNFTGDGNISNYHVLHNYVAYSKGQRIVGTMDNFTNTKVWICGYEYSSAQITKQDPNQAVVSGLVRLTPEVRGGYIENGTTKIEFNIANAVPKNIKYGVKIGRTEYGNNGADDTNTITGEFTGDATAAASQIIKGATAYVKGNKVTGTLSVNSALSFSAAAISSTEIEIYWTNPTKGPFNGVFVQMSTSGYPGVNGGTRVYTGIGTNSVAGGRSSCKITGLQPNTTYYFTACSYCDPLPWPDGTNLSAKTGSAGTKIFTSSQSWNIPAGVKNVDVFLVSGGCCGGDNGDAYFNICGGSGGYTQTYTNVDVSSINTINIIVGAGSRVSYTNENGGNKGGESSFGNYNVIGGSMIKITSVSPVIWQNRGGSGGGDRSVASITSATTIRAGNGGVDGANGTTNRASNVAVADRDYGKGQTITTRAFKEPSGTLYASGGGGGGSASRAQSSIEYTSARYGSGGIGGGGNGGNTLNGTQSPDPSELYLLNAQDGTPNTGSGGGGAGKDSWAFKVSTGFKTTIGVPGKGGSGIVIIRWK